MPTLTTSSRASTASSGELGIKLDKQDVKPDDIQTEQKKARKATERVGKVGLWMYLKTLQGISRIRETQSKMTDAIKLNSMYIKETVIRTTRVVLWKDKMSESAIQEADDAWLKNLDKDEKTIQRIQRDAAIEDRSSLSARQVTLRLTPIDPAGIDAFEKLYARDVSP